MSDLILDSHSIPALTVNNVDRLSALPPEILLIIYENLIRKEEEEEVSVRFRLFNRTLLPFEQIRLYHSVRYNERWPMRGRDEMEITLVGLTKLDRSLRTKPPLGSLVKHFWIRSTILPIEEAIGGVAGQTIPEVVDSLLTHLNRLQSLILVSIDVARPFISLLCANPTTTLYHQLRTLRIHVEPPDFNFPTHLIHLFPNLSNLIVIFNGSNIPAHRTLGPPSYSCAAERPVKLRMLAVCCTHSGWFADLFATVETQRLVFACQGVTEGLQMVNKTVEKLDLKLADMTEPLAFAHLKRFTSLTMLTLYGVEEYPVSIPATTLVDLLGSSLPITTIELGCGIDVNVEELTEALRGRPSSSPLQRIILENVLLVSLTSVAGEEQGGWTDICTAEDVDDLREVANELKIRLSGSTLLRMESDEASDWDEEDEVTRWRRNRIRKMLRKNRTFEHSSEGEESSDEDREGDTSEEDHRGSEEDEWSWAVMYLNRSEGND